MSKGLPLAIPKSQHSGTYVAGHEKGLWGHPYTGVQENFQWWDCIARFNDEVNIPVVLFDLFLIPMATTDLVLSSVVDSIFLPVDLLVNPEHENRYTGNCLYFPDET
jgi:hypothetical protein